MQPRHSEEVHSVSGACESWQCLLLGNYLHEASVLDKGIWLKIKKTMLQDIGHCQWLIPQILCQGLFDRHSLEREGLTGYLLDPICSCGFLAEVWRSPASNQDSETEKKLWVASLGQNSLLRKWVKMKQMKQTRVHF